MAAFPLSLRLVASPILGLLVARSWILERGGPIVTLRVDARHPLPPPTALLDLASAPDVRGLRMVLAGAGGAGFASLLATRRALAALTAAGKLVVVELEHAGNAELYLASAADRVWLRPERPVWLLGLAAVLRFWADALQKVGVTVDVEAVGEFKSFGEQYARRFPTPENRAATGVLVEDLQAELEEGIAAGRKLSREAVRAAMAAAPFTAEDALSHGLVDAVLYQDAADTELERLVGGRLREVPFERWHRAHRQRVRLAGWMARIPVIVAVFLEGPIVDGEGAPGAPVIAELPTLRVLKALTEDERVRGVVVHIRSPGGSASASDAIWRGVRRLHEAKPVVAALSDVAASGGYYIAVGAAEIVAEASTLTGSIGVIAARPVVRAALERLGVHSEIVKGAPMADFFTDGEWSPEQRARYRRLLEAMYASFVERVAHGRNRAVAEVEPHARGRVWTGRRALDLGLVDALGGMEEAMARVAHRAGLRQSRRVDLYVARRGNRLVRLLRSAIGAMIPELRALRLPSAGARMLLESDGAPLYAWPIDLDVR